MKTQELNFAQNFVNTEKKVKTENAGLFTKQVELFERNRFALMALFLTLQSCVGGIAAMYLLETNANDLYLMLCAGITMLANALLIAQAGAKTCLIAVYANILVNTALIVAHL